jgi:hypothetical protein
MNYCKLGPGPASLNLRELDDFNSSQKKKTCSIKGDLSKDVRRCG